MYKVINNENILSIPGVIRTNANVERSYEVIRKNTTADSVQKGSESSKSQTTIKS